MTLPNPNANVEDLSAIERILNMLSLNQTESTRLQNERFELELIQLVNQLIPEKFEGKTEERQDFIKQCDILKARGTTENFKKLLFQNVKNKLKGPALACLPETAASVDDIINAVKTLKVDSIEKTQEKLNQINANNMSKEKFKERLVALLEELERGYLAMGGTAQSIRSIIMEKTALVLKRQTSDVGLYALLKTEQNNMKSPSQLIDYFYTEKSS